MSKLDSRRKGVCRHFLSSQWRTAVRWPGTNWAYQENPYETQIERGERSFLASADIYTHASPCTASPLLASQHFRKGSACFPGSNRGLHGVEVPSNWDHQQPKNPVPQTRALAGTAVRETISEWIFAVRQHQKGCTIELEQHISAAKRRDRSKIHCGTGWRRCCRGGCGGSAGRIDQLLSPSSPSDEPARQSAQLTERREPDRRACTVEPGLGEVVYLRWSEHQRIPGKPCLRYVYAYVCVLTGSWAVESS